MDPMTGSTGFADWHENEGFGIALEAGESVFLVVRNGSPIRKSVSQERKIAAAKVEVSGPWTLVPVVGGPTVPSARKMEKLSSWSLNEDGSENSFCGTMRYSCSFDYHGSGGDIVEFDLGDVRQSARVKINGKDVGFAIMPPYRVTVPASLLMAKGNILEVEVTSTGANRIRHNDRTGVKWKYFRDANVVAYGYKGQLNATNWPLADCGLLGPVRYCDK
jgi:hypothetical protein